MESTNHQYQQPKHTTRQTKNQTNKANPTHKQQLIHDIKAQ